MPDIVANPEIVTLVGARSRLGNSELMRRSYCSFTTHATVESMPMFIEQRQRSIHPLLVLSGIAALMDTVIGVIINLALDHSRPYDNLLGISLVLGLPMYWLDVRLKKRFAFFLAFLFVSRSLIRILPSDVIGNPIDWPVGILLFSSLVLLQLYKLRNKIA